MLNNKENFKLHQYTNEELDELIQLIEEEKQIREDNLKKEFYDKMAKIYDEIIAAGFTLYYDYDAIDMSDLYIK